MIYNYELNGVEIRTGDLICTSDGGHSIISGQFWWLVGKLIPGDVDHVAIYVGPEGRCVEAGAKGVITFDIYANHWDATAMLEQRLLEDELYGIARPLRGRGLSVAEKDKIREGVAEYCLSKAAMGRGYNLNFFDSDNDRSFYCSQLVYKAYLKYGIDLNTGIGVPDIPGTESIIFPQEIWEGCEHQRVY